MNKIKTSFQDNTKWRVLLLSVLLMGLAHGIYKGILDNYLVEVGQMTGFDKGVSEFFRELPGLLLVFIFAILYTFSAEKIYKIGSVIVLVGMMLHAVVPPDKILLIGVMFVYSLGEHMRIATRYSLSIEYSSADCGGEALGYTSSANQIGNLVGYAVIVISFVLLRDKQPFKLFFFIAAIVSAIGMFCSFGLTSSTETDKTKSRFYFRKKFVKFYMLEVFYGARKQVFFTFGPYVLILFYGASAAVISTLFALSSISCFLLAPLVGKIIDKAGYRIIMIVDTVILVAVCFFYGFAHHLFPKNVAFIVCCVNYLLDSIISIASMASNVYVQDISDSPEECRATISTGLSVNHMITVLIALFGGWIWQNVGIEILFMISAVLGLCNSAYAASIPKVGKAMGTRGSKQSQ